MKQIPESDWKQFKKIRADALERLCERALADLVATATQSSDSQHSRYLAVYRKIEEYDEQIASAFDGLSRSRMMVQLAIMFSLDLVDDSDLESFSEETKARLRILSSM